MAGTIEHSWNGSVLTITSDSGTSSADLRGLKGDDGPRGPAGATETNAITLQGYGAADFARIADGALRAKKVLDAGTYIVGEPVPFTQDLSPLHAIYGRINYIGTNISMPYGSSPTRHCLTATVPSNDLGFITIFTIVISKPDGAVNEWIVEKAIRTSIAANGAITVDYPTEITFGPIQGLLLG